MPYEKNILQNPFHPCSDDFGGKVSFTNAGDNDPPVTFEHFSIDDPNWSVDKIRSNDTNELLCFFGGNPENIRDLGAEIHLFVGDEQEEQIIHDATMVSLPAGLKSGNISIKNYTHPFSVLRVINSKAYQDKLADEAGAEDMFSIEAMTNGNDVTKFGKRYWMNMIRGPLFIDYEPGWTGTSVWAHNNEYKIGISLGYHCLNDTYDVGFSHYHHFHENLCFLSGDPDNPEELGAEISIKLGDELEEQVFSKPGIISMPPGLVHCPMLVHNVKKPVVFLEVSAATLFKGIPMGS